MKIIDSFWLAGKYHLFLFIIVIPRKAELLQSIL